MKKVLLFVIAVLSLSIFAACGENSDDPIFFISAIPDQNLSDVHAAMDELASILSEATGLNVQHRGVTDYAAVVSGFAREEIQLAWFGGLTGVQGRAQLPNSVAVAQRYEDTGFTSVFIAGTHTNIYSMADFPGYSFTFASESSTSGHLMPRYYLYQWGIIPEDDFDGHVGYSGSHDRVIELVTNGTFDSGALNDIIWNRHVNEGLIDFDRVRFITYTPEFYNYNFSMASRESIDAAYGEGAFDSIVEALMNVDIASNPALNTFFVSEGFIPTNNDNYHDIEMVARMLGLIQ